MIFVTVGTILPFDRLIKAMDDWATERGYTDIFAQVGDQDATGYQPRAFDWTARLTPMEFRDRVTQADVVVTHAGIGTMLSALSNMTPVLVMPRLAELREVVNDHQLETIRRFADRPGVSIAMETQDLAPKLDAVLAGSREVARLSDGADDSLIQAIRSVIHKP